MQYANGRELEGAPSNKISFAERNIPIASRNACEAPSGRPSATVLDNLKLTKNADGMEGV